jgi:hypothetical protein
METGILFYEVLREGSGVVLRDVPGSVRRQASAFDDWAVERKMSEKKEVVEEGVKRNLRRRTWSVYDGTLNETQRSKHKV